MLIASVLLQPTRNYAAFALGLGFWLVWTPWQDFQLARRESSPSSESVAYADLARLMNRPTARTETVIVGDSPYTYTLVTSVPALSIPESDDSYLLSYMKKYHARWVLLTPRELAFWRPKWADGIIPSELVRRPDLADGRGVVFERIDQP